MNAESGPCLAHLIENRRQERLDRKRKRALFGRTSLNIEYTKLCMVHRVQTQAVSIPQWAEKYRIRDFSAGHDLLWCKFRWVARKVAQLDRDSFGCPVISEHQAYMCPTCRMYKLGLDARALCDRVEAARLAGIEFGECGIHCTKVTQRKAAR